MHGVVLTLAVDDALWRRLDDFEADEYERVLVRTDAGETVFTYDWRAPLDGLALIAGGRWHELEAKNRD